MASDIWLRTILIVRKETHCRHIGYRLAARVLLYAPSHRQDSTYHGLCYTSRGALAGTRNSSMGFKLRVKLDDHFNIAINFECSEHRLSQLRTWDYYSIFFFHTGIAINLFSVFPVKCMKEKFRHFMIFHRMYNFVQLAVCSLKAVFA